MGKARKAHHSCGHGWASWDGWPFVPEPDYSRHDDYEAIRRVVRLGEEGAVEGGIALIDTAALARLCRELEQLRASKQ